MKYLALHIDTSPAGLEAVENMLDDLGIEGLVIEDESDFRKFLEENKQYWDYVDEELDRAMSGKCRVTFYVEDSGEGLGKAAQVRIAMAELKERRPECAPLLMTVDGVEDADWENNWKEYYKPIEIGERLLIIPDWLEAECAGRIPLRLDPGLAFGTGSHATTRLCLEAMENLVKPGCRVLDLGCGSGILFIAALLLGASSAYACDIDPKAVDAARSNAALNGIGAGRFTLRAGDVLKDKALRRELEGGYELITANIVADVIIALAPAVGALMKPDGAFLCSGIIEGRENEVRQALEAAGLQAVDTAESGGWFRFVCTRKERQA